MTKNLNDSSMNSTSYSSGSGSNVNNTSNNSLNIDIQAQFELCVELRRFVNIDLFQRGFVIIFFFLALASPIYLNLISSNRQLLPNKMRG